MLRVLPDNEKNFTQSQEIEISILTLCFDPTLKLDLCKRFADAQTAARFIYNSKHIGMGSLLTLESLDVVNLNKWWNNSLDTSTTISASHMAMEWKETSQDSQ